jgi:fatty-acyl-CoA synthase
LIHNGVLVSTLLVGSFYSTRQAYRPKSTQRQSFKKRGEWISSLQLEDLILRHPGVAEAAVIGVPDPKWIERPLALLVARAGQAVSEEEIRTQLHNFAAKGIIPRYSVPERIVFVEALPKTSVGKLDKKVLRERYAQ